MKTNKLFGFITIIVAVIVFSMAGCLFEGPHEHEWGPWGIVNSQDQPTCSRAGKETRYCTGYITSKGWCQAMETRAVPPDPSLHVFGQPKDEDIIVEPTCTAGGSGTSYCSNGCGTSKTVDMPIRHSFDGGGRTIKEPTCTSSGSYEMYCTKCGLHYTGTSSPLGHAWVASQTGHWLTQYKCSRCGIFGATKY